MEPTADLVLVAVDGYTTDISHDAYSAEFEAAADDLSAGMAALITAQIDEEVPDRIDVTDQLDPGAMRAFEDARRAVGLIDLLSVALPVVGAGLIGLVYLVYGLLPLTAMGGGVGLAVGGLPTLVGARFVHGLLRDRLAGGELPAGVGELFVAIAGQVADAVFLQSAVVVGLGVVAFAVGLAIHLGWVTLPATAE